MSDQVKVAAEQAYNTLVGELAAPYFFEKLAANGVRPETEKEAAEMWAVANKLHVLYSAAREEEAANKTTKLAAASARLDEVLYGRRDSGAAQEKFAAFRGAADVAANQPHIANAVLTLQAAAAAALNDE